eukprot:Skav201240  [mRNA]  locus=scaffold3106:22300:28507:- [translate_table: standard]
MAAANGQTEALQTLLFYKADFETLGVVEDDSGLTAFLLAVTHDRLSAVQCMLPPKLPITMGNLGVSTKKGGRSGSREPPPDRRAPKGGTSAKASPAPKSRLGNKKKLVKEVREKRGSHLSNGDLRTPFNKIGKRLVCQHDLEERTALCLAVMDCNSNMVQLLLSAKAPCGTPPRFGEADLESTDAHGNGVLHYACINRDREQVAVFLDLNARVDRLNKQGSKPEDPDILHMIQRKLVSKKLETLPASPTHVAPPVKVNLEAWETAATGPPKAFVSRRALDILG